MATKSKVAKKERAPLPKTFRGAETVRGLGMKSGEIDTFVEERSMDQFDAQRPTWIVVEDHALNDPDNTCEIKAFVNKADAVRFAQARASGNVDHRVLRVAEHVLVVGTMNDL
jgi:hypothetical protein